MASSKAERSSTIIFLSAVLPHLCRLGLYVYGAYQATAEEGQLVRVPRTTRGLRGKDQHAKAR